MGGKWEGKIVGKIWKRINVINADLRRIFPRKLGGNAPRLRLARPQGSCSGNEGAWQVAAGIRQGVRASDCSEQRHLSQLRRRSKDVIRRDALAKRRALTSARRGIEPEGIRQAKALNLPMICGLTDHLRVVGGDAR